MLLCPSLCHLVQLKKVQGGSCEALNFQYLDPSQHEAWATPQMVRVGLCDVVPGLHEAVSKGPQRTCLGVCQVRVVLQIAACSVSGL